MMTDLKKNILVVGCGIFGAEIAIELASLGATVSIYETKGDILLGASSNNQNRLHQGFHYPRDLETGRQSLRGFNRFKTKYADAIQGEFPNAYFIANLDSLTTAEDYFRFCENLGAPYKKIDRCTFPIEVHGVSTGILCDEVVYDCNVLRRLVWDSLCLHRIPVALNCKVERITRDGLGYVVELADGSIAHADIVINTSYADINRLTRCLGHSVPKWQYEYTVVPIVDLDLPRVGVTVMDGPFMTLLPYGKSNDFLLYHVQHSVISRYIGTQLDRNWLLPEEGPFSSIDRSQFFEDMLSSCQEFIPYLRGAKIKGFLEGPRMVAAYQDSTDARPSIITSYDMSYYTVMAGKIDHCMWVASDLSTRVVSEF
jgi:glycine/D-amino acid oxidase-like deaminating enzyme